MKQIFVIFLVLFIFASMLVMNTTGEKEISNVGVEFKPQVIFTNTTVWEDVDLTLNESIEIQAGGNLTIINSKLTFINPDAGFVINGGELTLKNSMVFDGDKLVKGSTNGVLQIEDTTFSNSGGDAINLEGDYKVKISGSSFKNGAKDGLQFLDFTQPAVITDSEIINFGKDGFNVENTDLELTNILIDTTGDEGIQFDGAGSLTAKNIVAKNIGADGIKARDIIGTLTFENITITGTGDDGIQIQNSQSVTMKDISIDTTSENGFETDNTNSFVITGLTIANAGIKGMEIINVTSMDIDDLTLTSNAQYGIQAENIMDFSVSNSLISGNAIDVDDGIGGIDLLNVKGSISRSKIFDNVNFDINVTNLNGEIFDAVNNYWGTEIIDEVAAFGNVTIDTILDENLNAITTPLELSNEKDTPYPSFLVFLMPFVLIPKLRKSKTS